MAYVNIKRKDLQLVNEIGKGGFSRVFKALWNGQEVAAKRLIDMDKHEVEVLSQLHHPNIVHLIGVIDENFELYLILELCKGGSLRSYLNEHKSKGTRLSTKHVYNWANQAIKPIQYLKENNIVHKDVKSPNYLIADGNVLKLADFGLAKTLDRTIYDATKRASHPWMAPELLKDGVLSPTYDIYAFGVVVWELWTTEMPFEGSEYPNIMWRICSNNERPPIPSDCPKELADLMRQCWETDWHKRPTIEHILSVLLMLESAEMELMRKKLIAGPWVLEKEFGQHGSGKLTYACGIAVNPNRDIAIADGYAAQVKVYSIGGEYKLNLDTAQGLNPGTTSHPRNVTVNSEGNYYVTDETRYVKEYDVKGVYTGKWVAVSPDNKPSDTENTSLCGLAIDAKNQLLVGECNYRYISRHRQNGSHITSIKVGIGPYNLAVTSQDAIIISDWVNNAVQIVDSTGQLLQTLKPTPRRPWGVCCYEDIIFICNPLMTRPEICCFSASGEYLGSIAVTGLPRDITFVRGSNKFLLACGNRVQVYSCKK